MNKTELTEIVDRVYATWNKVINKEDQKTVYNAWWMVIQHLDADSCHAEISRAAISDKYMPTPGAIYRSVCLKSLYSSGDYDAPPSAEAAWSILQRLGAASARGEFVQESLHTCVRMTIEALGGTSALSLHTNGDRRSFEELYNRTVQSWQNELIQNNQKATTRI